MPLTVLARPGVVVLARLGRPPRIDARIEGPVRQVEPLHRVRAGLAGEAVRRQPLPAVPGTNQVARVRLRNGHRQQRLGPNRVLHLLVWHERGRATELAALRDHAGVEDRDRLAALALHGDLLGVPAPGAVGNGTQRRRQVVLDDDRGVVALFEFGWRLGAAVRAHQRMLGGVPLRLTAARRAFELPASHGDTVALRRRCGFGLTWRLHARRTSGPATSGSRRVRRV